MTRHAFLIGDPGPANAANFLPGVDFDIKNYIRFLASPSGGAWEKHEITALLNPSKQKLLELLQASAAEYALIIFSGHGSTSTRTKATMLAINERETVQSTQLKTPATQQLVILDSCRTFVDSGVSEFLGEGLRCFPSSLPLQQARQLFASQLQKCPDGRVVCYSCLEGEGAMDSNNGGHFTMSLLDIAKRWIDKPGSDQILTIQPAVIAAKLFINKRLKPVQTPQIKVSAPGKLFFPFALRKPAEIL
jgi:hypothetical protein